MTIVFVGSAAQAIELYIALYGEIPTSPTITVSVPTPGVIVLSENTSLEDEGDSKKVAALIGGISSDPCGERLISELKKWDVEACFPSTSYAKEESKVETYVPKNSKVPYRGIEKTKLYHAKLPQNQFRRR